ncbi:MAG: asparagine synthetase B [archaeon]
MPKVYHSSIKLDDGSVICDSEIYNFCKLTHKYNIKASDDPELFSGLIRLKGLGALDEVDGVYSLAYFSRDSVVLARDIIGVKPLFYSTDKGLAFSFIRNDLIKIGYKNVFELKPTKMLRYDRNTRKITFINRRFFSVRPELSSSEGVIVQNLLGMFVEAVDKRLPNKKFGVLFSGGIDSTLISQVCKRLKGNFVCYNAYFDYPGVQKSEDFVYAGRVVKKLGFRLKVVKVDLKKAERMVKRLVPLVGPDAVKVGVALPAFAACELAKKDGCNFVFSGLGSEELFAGYLRHKESSDVNKECLKGLLQMYERDTYRDYVVADLNHVKIEVPFLDTQLVDYSLKVPARFKLNKGVEKCIIRKVALDLGIPEEFAFRKKKAAQYGSNSDKALSKLARLNGFKYKKDYLNSLMSL